MQLNSFMSEHTIEYAIINQICCYFGLRNKRVTPVYIFQTREGNSLGKTSFKNEVRAFAIYPRRPKINSWKDDVICFKLNYSVLCAADFLNTHGIPTYFSGPLIKRLDEYDLNTKLFIAKMSYSCQYKKDIFISLKKQGDLITKPEGIKELSLNYLEEDIEINAQYVLWYNVIDIIKESNYLQAKQISRSYYFPFMLQYKPVMFILNE